MSSLATRLQTARRKSFFGRSRECQIFQEILTDPTSETFVLYIYGPGGIGKTTLLRRFSDMAMAQDMSVYAVDCRDIEPFPERILQALQQTLNTEDAHAFLEHPPKRTVLIFDTYEYLASMDGWLREVFLPHLHENVIVIIAGRLMPSLPWRADPGWQAVVQILSLRNLSGSESEAYLKFRRVPAGQYENVLAFTHGHPLALSLVADMCERGSTTHFRPENAPDILRLLMSQLLQEVVTPEQRMALESCALVRFMTEPLLAEMVDSDTAQALFTWLYQLSCIEVERRGLFLHDLAREVIAADLRWRNPTLYADLHERARNYFMAGLENSSHQEQQQYLLDITFLHNANEIVRTYFEWDESNPVYLDGLKAGDIPVILAMVTQHEGQNSAELASGWLNEQPRHVRVFRDMAGDVAGWLLLLSLTEIPEGMKGADAGVVQGLAYLEAFAPLRPGEKATYFRYWMAKDDYQAVSAIQSRMFITMVQHYMATPDLAFSFICCADPAHWQPILHHVDYQRIVEADFTVDGKSFGVFGHDWRHTPLTAWLALIAERQLMLGEATAPESVERLVVLNKEDFELAVREALRNMKERHLLGDNALLKSRVIVDYAGTESKQAKRIEALCDLLTMTASQLAESTRGLKFYRALNHTFFQPAPTQEQAAEQLGLPFSTYRRHLRQGIQALVELLWKRELGEL